MNRLAVITTAAACLCAGVLIISAPTAQAGEQYVRYRDYGYDGAACPPGYDGSSGRCISPHGYDLEDAVPCPPGYSGESGECVGHRGRRGNYARQDRRRSYGHHRYGPVPCPPGYDGSSGECR